MSKEQEQRIRELEAEIDRLRTELQQAIDMRADWESQLAMIADTIGLETEPHQTYFERLQASVRQLRERAEAAEQRDRVATREFCNAHNRIRTLEAALRECHDFIVCDQQAIDLDRIAALAGQSEAKHKEPTMNQEQLKHALNCLSVDAAYGMSDNELAWRLFQVKQPTDEAHGGELAEPCPAGQPDESDALAALNEIMPELEFGRETHVQWRDYLRQHPDGEKRNPECGDADFHDKMVEVYDKRLAAINKARRALAAEQEDK